MANRHMILTLAKVIIAAAWADGNLTLEESNNLKEMLLRLRSTGFARDLVLTGREWAMLEMYMTAPINTAERARLVVELQNALRTKEQQQIAVTALHDVMLADGEFTDAERRVLAEIETAINEVAVGLSGAMERLVGTTMRQRRSAAGQAPNREDFFDDFLQNKVYYALARHLEQTEVDLALTEADQRKLGLAGGLMAKIAHADGSLNETEFQTMVTAIERYWNIDKTAATLVTEIALAAVSRTYEMTRLVKSLAEVTTVAERRGFLAALFAVAAADGEIAMVEHEEIRIIARGLLLTHDDFIQAKLQVLGKR